MSHRKASNFLSAKIDSSNHSIVDFLGSPSSRQSCHICKETQNSDGLAEFCRCDFFIHEHCIAKVIDDWISDDSSQNDDSSARTQTEKPYICRSCNQQVYYKSKHHFACRSGSQICMQFKKGPLKSFFQIFFFCLGVFGLIFGILVKSGKYSFEIGLNPMILSVATIGVMIVASLIILVPFYYIFVEMLTDKRKRVQKVYQRAKKDQGGQRNSITIIQIS